MAFAKSYKFLIITLVCFLLGLLSEKNILFPRFDDAYAKRFQKELIKKENEIIQHLDIISDSLQGSHIVHIYEPKISINDNLLDKKGLAFFVFQNDSLKYWSDNSVPTANLYSKSGLDSTTFIYLGNAWYVPKIRKSNNIIIVGLILIKQVYQYDNKLLKTEFQREFSYPPSVKISSEPLPNSYPITNYKNQYLFSLVFDNSTKHAVFELFFPSIFYGCAIIFLLLFINQYIHSIDKTARRHRSIIIFALSAFGIKIGLTQLGLPSVFYKTDLFNPFNFAASEMFSSLGELFFWTILIFFFSMLLYREFDLTGIVQKNVHRKYKNRVILSLHLIVVTGVFVWIFFMLKSIILNSTISFEINKITSFSLYSVISYIILILLYLSFCLLLDKAISQFKGVVSFRNYLVINLIVLLLWGVFVFVFNLQLPVIAFVVLAGLFFISGYIRLRDQISYNYSALAIIVFLFSIITVFFITTFSKDKSENIRKVYLVGLANENDRICEFLLNDRIQESLKNDSLVHEFLFNEYFSINQLYNHLKGKYFNSYFDKFNLQITVCSEADSVFIDSDDRWQHCYTFFGNIINEKGSRIFSTDFYYIDYFDGQVNYLGNIEYFDKKKGKVTLFIELSSKLMTEQLGYPALLLDEKMSYQLLPKGYSYAKYYKGQLISQFGKHSYNLTSTVFEAEKKDFGILKFKQIEHMIHRPGKDTLIVLSSSATGLMDWIISFSYTFLLFFILLNIILLFIRFELIKQMFYPSFKNKIQFGIIAFLFPSLVLIGGVSLYLNIRQHYNKNIEIISEKLQSIYIELSNKLGDEEKINSDSYPYGNLNEVLIRFSNVFYIDINLYDKDGSLLATSRPEFFEKGLIGKRINPEAYKSMINDMMAEVVKTEKIGALKYFSAYIPFKNSNNKLLAFINVPYFTRQEEFAEEISRMAVTVSNVFVLLFLVTSVIAIFISRKITLPLTEIQLKFSRIRLGQKYEQISYKANDEIGGLVNEYNRMVTELERSVELLAKSERESAWREMAKQIAHEINNPLTPMKLSVQHLQRAWADKRDNFETTIERVCKMLIDEIDNLSSIATEFSNFAKMPKTNSQRLDLIEKIDNVVSLFSSSEVNFTVSLNGIQNIFVFADKEQLSRVFINLIKNAIQSVEKHTKPLIVIDINKLDNNVIIKVSDNGKGIPEEMQEKLFSPNFTTKTSGMGLGLAIVKKIIEEAGGSISFETEENMGTTFIISFPVFE